MKKLLSEKIVRIIKNKKRLEELLNVKIVNRGKEVFISGEAEDEYVAQQVIEALDFGFPFSTVILLKNEEGFTFDVINIKEHTKRHNLEAIRARIIGKRGKALSTLQNLTNSYFEIKDNQIGIIAPSEFIENASNAVIAIIKGAKHATVYKFLEREKYKEVEDLGLK